MAVNFAIPFGPIFDPDYGLSSWGFVDDFIGYWDSTTPDAGPWVDVGTSGTTTVSTTEQFGAIAMTNGDAVDEDGGIELNGESILFDHTRDMIFGVRVKLSAITGTNLFVGLHLEAFDVGVATGGGSLTAEHIGFHTQGDASIDFSSADGTNASLTDTTDDFVADTYRLLVMKYTAVDRALRFYVDGVYRGKHVVGTDNVPASNTPLTLGLHSEFNTASVTATFDYVYVAGER